MRRPNHRVLRRLAALACLMIALVWASGCGVVERRIGPMYPKVLDTRVEMRDAPVPDWQVWVFVNEQQVGAYKTDSNGEVRMPYGPYLAEAMNGKGLKVEFRFQQADGKVEQRWYTLTAEQLRAGAR